MLERKIEIILINKLKLLEGKIGDISTVKFDILGRNIGDILIERFNILKKLTLTLTGRFNVFILIGKFIILKERIEIISTDKFIISEEIILI